MLTYTIKIWLLARRDEEGKSAYLKDKRKEN